MPTEKITAWSYSRYNVYSTCPRKACYKFIDKIPEEQNEAMARGSAVHKKAEDYMVGRLKKLPYELWLFKGHLEEVKKRAKDYFVEQNWAFTKGFGKAVDWFDRTVWVRIKADLGFILPKDNEFSEGEEVLVIVDYKTGKVRNEEYEDQLELSAVGGFEKFKDIQTVVAQNWYLDHGPKYTNELTYRRKDLAKTELKWSRKVKPMLNDITYSPRPGHYCRWCSFAKSKGGPCDFG